MASDPLESAIYQELARVYVCTLDELSGLLLSRFSPAQVSVMVHRMIEMGSIARRSSDPSRVLLWLPPLRSGRRQGAEAPVGNSVEGNPTEIEATGPDFAPSGIESGQVTSFTQP